MGIPTVLICAIVPIALTVGANRMVRGVAIPHPTGDPSIEKSGEVDIRKKLLTLALKGLESKIEEQTVYKEDL